MLKDYESYLLQIRDSLIRCGVGVEIKDRYTYEDLFYLGEGIADLLWLYSKLEVINSRNRLRGFIYPLGTSLKDFLRRYFYKEFCEEEELHRELSVDEFLRNKKAQEEIEVEEFDIVDEETEGVSDEDVKEEIPESHKSNFYNMFASLKNSSTNAVSLDDEDDDIDIEADEVSEWYDEEESEEGMGEDEEDQEEEISEESDWCSEEDEGEIISNNGIESNTNTGYNNISTIVGSSENIEEGLNSGGVQNEIEEVQDWSEDNDDLEEISEEDDIPDWDDEEEDEGYSEEDYPDWDSDEEENEEVEEEEVSDWNEEDVPSWDSEDNGQVELEGIEEVPDWDDESQDEEIPDWDDGSDQEEVSDWEEDEDEAGEEVPDWDEEDETPEWDDSTEEGIEDVNSFDESDFPSWDEEEIQPSNNSAQNKGISSQPVKEKQKVNKPKEVIAGDNTLNFVNNGMKKGQSLAKGTLKRVVKLFTDQE